MQNVIGLILVIGLGFFSGCSNADDTKALPENTRFANIEVGKVFEKLDAGVSSSELKKVLKSSTAHIGLLWRGDLPKVDNFTTQDKLCFYAAKEIIPSSGSNQYYPVDYANIIAVAVDKDKDCEEDSFYAKSLLLLSWKSYIHYAIVKKKDYDILDDLQLQKYNDAIVKAKKLHKQMMLVVFDTYFQGNNKKLKQTIESTEIKEMINNSFVYVEYEGVHNLDRTQIGSITAVPMTYFFDADGKLVREYRGVPRGTQDYEKYINIMRSVINGNK